MLEFAFLLDSHGSDAHSRDPTMDCGLSFLEGSSILVIMCLRRRHKQSFYKVPVPTGPTVPVLPNNLPSKITNPAAIHPYILYRLQTVLELTKPLQAITEDPAMQRLPRLFSIQAKEVRKACFGEMSRQTQ